MHHLYGNKVSGRNRICSTGTNSSWNNFSYIVLALYHCGCWIKECSHATKILGWNSDQNYLLFLLHFQSWMGDWPICTEILFSNVKYYWSEFQWRAAFHYVWTLLNLMVYFHLRLCFEDVRWHALCIRLTNHKSNYRQGKHLCHCLQISASQVWIDH